MVRHVWIFFPLNCVSLWASDIDDFFLNQQNHVLNNDHEQILLNFHCLKIFMLVFGYFIECLLCGQYDVFLVSCVSHDGLGRQFLSAFWYIRNFAWKTLSHTHADIQTCLVNYAISKTITMPQKFFQVVGYWVLQMNPY